MLNNPRYEVHDEDGALRAFWTKQEAVHFAKGTDYSIVTLAKPAKESVINWNDYEESPF